MDRQLLNRATDGSDAPTPGYLYLDIAKNASSSPMACQEIATFLTRKLANKQNANIKWKCLKVISKTAESVGRGQFKRAVAQDQSAVAAIRLATNFRGPPDPVRGDEPYNRVRLAAKECLDIIYSDTPAQTEQSPYASASQMSNTYGAPSHQQPSPSYNGGGGGMPTPGSGRRMEGIGNPMFSDPRLEPQPKTNLEAIIKDVGESFVGMIKDPLARNVDVRSSNGHGEMPRPGGMQGYGNPSAGSYGRPPPGRGELAHATGGQWTMASNRGPNAVTPSASNSNDAYYKSREQANNAFSWAHNNAGQHGPGASGVGGSWASPSVAAQARQPSYAEQHSATPSITINAAPVPYINHGGGGTAVTDGSYEKNLVLELCPAGGMKPVPPPDKLLDFAKAIPSLNSDLICPVLLDLLEEGHPWIMRAKALCVMETCIQAGQRDDGSNPYATFFYTCRGEIEPLAGHARAAVKDPAQRVLALMGIEATQPMAAPPTMAPPVPPPAAPVNLLDFDDAPAVTPAVPPPSAPPPPPAQATNMGGADLFGGMQLKAAAATTPVAAPVQAPRALPPAPTSGNLLDGLAMINPPAPAPLQSTEVIDMFGSLSVKSSEIEDEKKKGSEDADDLAAVAASGSAFGFMNDESSKSIPSRESFDPLSNFSPNSSRQTMALSPEQMQAMQYQQMLMQAQYQQMQQMQMAMAMQQGGGMVRMPVVPMPMMHGLSGQRPGVMGPHAGKTSSGFSFLDNPATKKQDHSFDFVQDAIKTEKTNK